MFDVRLYSFKGLWLWPSEILIRQQIQQQGHNPEQLLKGESSSLLECQNRGVLAWKVDELRPEQLLMVKLNLSAIITEGASQLCRLNPSECVKFLVIPCQGAGRVVRFSPDFLLFLFFLKLNLLCSKLKTLQDRVGLTNWGWSTIPLETTFRGIENLSRNTSERWKKKKMPCHPRSNVEGNYAV